MVNTSYSDISNLSGGGGGYTNNLQDKSRKYKAADKGIKEVEEGEDDEFESPLRKKKTQLAPLAQSKL